MPVKAIVEATERSMPPIRMTRDWPRATMMRVQVSLRIELRFSGARKPGARSDTRAQNAMRVRRRVVSLRLRSRFIRRPFRGGRRRPSPPS